MSLNLLNTTVTSQTAPVSSGDPNMGFVILMGVITVFVCLISLIIIIKIMSSIVLAATKSKTAAAATPAAPVASAAAAPAQSADKQKLVAAIAVAIAEDMGTDVDHIKIHSIKRI